MAEGLMERGEQETFSFRPPARPMEGGGKEQPLEIGLLVVAFNSVLARIPPRPVVVTGRTWTLAEKLDLITQRLREGPIELLELILESEDRLEAGVTVVAGRQALRGGVIQRGPKGHFLAVPYRAQTPNQG